MTTKEKATQGTEEQSVAVNDTIDLKSEYEKLLARQEEFRALAAAQGITLEEPPPGDMIVAYKDSNEVLPGAQTDAKGLQWKSWNKRDLDKNPEQKFSFVPQVVPGLVHPLLDENRRARIILDINDLKCCLTCNVLNENISGMFYWAYKNAEEEWLKTEATKNQGPGNGPHVSGGPGGTNTWHYEPEVPSAWIEIDGGYYKPGAVMPNQEVTAE